VRVYLLQTIFREHPFDSLRIGSFNWPFIAQDDSAAKERAESMLTNWKDPNFVNWWETGNAIRILAGEKEIVWKSFDKDSPYATWS
jgi:hypothetical protein